MVGPRSVRVNSRLRAALQQAKGRFRIGRRRHEEARSDIWALGIVLFEVLAGYWPFQDATAYELVAAILGDQPLLLAHLVRSGRPGQCVEGSGGPLWLGTGLGSGAQ